MGESVGASELLREFKELLSSRPWNMVIAAIQEQIDNLQQEILFGAVLSEGDVLRVERLKGQLEGRLALRGVAETLLSNYEYDVKVNQEAGHVEN